MPSDIHSFSSKSKARDDANSEARPKAPRRTRAPAGRRRGDHAAAHRVVEHPRHLWAEALGHARARRGEVSGVVAVDLPFAEPLAPDLVLDNEEKRDDLTPLARIVLDEVAKAQAR